MAVQDPLIGQQLDQYRVIDLVGRGGMGAVYRSRDERDGTEVALKVLAFDRLDDIRDAERFRREARLAAGLDHPNVVAVYDSGQVEGYLYMVMELVEGQSLRQRLRARGKLELELALQVTGQVLEALWAAHGQGIVHRDIKAENVLLRADGVAKVLDFGVAKLDRGTVLTRANEILGTVEYMAPEQILGDAVGPAADLYAVGVLLYEMLTGVLPFTGDSPATLVYHQLNEDPPAPSALNAAVPRVLDRLVLRLLDKEPENRCGSAAEVLEKLGDIRGRLQLLDVPGAAWAEGEVDEEAELRTRHFKPRFVGRQEEFEKLAGHFAGLEQEGRVVFLAGEAGAGKTRLVEELQGHVEARGGRCARGICFFEHGLGPFMPILDALGDLFSKEVNGLAEDEREELVAFLAQEEPELARVAEGGTTTARVRAGFAAAFGTEENQAAAGQRFFDTVFEVLARVSKQEPLVVVLEDMHWADEGSQQLLGYLARRASEIPLLCLATYRPEEEGNEGEERPPLAGMRRQLAAEGRLQEVRLERLNAAAVGQLARSLFLEAEFSPDFGDFLHEQSQGNPFIALEVLKLLRQQGVLYCESGVWFTRPDLAETVIPERVGALVMSRVELLDEELRDLLDLAAVLGPRFTSQVLGKAIGMGRIPLLKALYRLEKQHRLIEGDNGAYVFAHGKIREVLYAEIPPELRIEYHRVAAAVLEEQQEEGQAVDDGELGQHLFLAGEHGRALPYLHRAGEAAFLMFGWRQAISFLDQVVEAARQAGADPEIELRALMLAGRCWESLTAFDCALERFAEMEQVAQQAGQPEDEADALIHVGRVQGWLGQPAEAEKAYQRSLELVENGRGVATRGRALLNWGKLDFEAGRYEEAEQRWQEARELLEEAGADEVRNTLNNLAVLATVRGDLERAWEFYEQALEREAAEKPSLFAASVCENMGMLRADQERWDEALELFARSLDICRQARFFGQEPGLHLNRAEALIGKGNLVEAHQACSQALRGFRRLEDGLGIADALRLSGRICRLEHSWDEGRACLEKSVALNRQFGETVSLGEALYELGLLARDAGQQAMAVEPLQEAGQIFARIEAAPDLERVQVVLEELQGA